MHYSKAVQFSEVVLIFVRIYLRLVTAPFATLPPACVQQATCLTSFLIYPSQLIEANLFVDLLLVVLHHFSYFPSGTLSYKGFLAFHLGGLSLVWSRLAEVIPVGGFQAAEMKTF